MTSIEIPELSLVALIGPSGSGKSTFAKKHFSPTEVISSDACRGLVSDDENSQEATSDAFDLLFTIAAKRLKNGRLTVIDATSVQAEDRKKLIKLAREYHCLPTAIVLDMPEDLCQERNKSRPDRTFGPHVIRNQKRALRQGMGRNRKGLQREGFRYVKVLNSPEEVEAATITRTPLWNNKKGEHGPFDIVGDVHGCYDELVSLIGELGYEISPPDPGAAEGDLAITCPTTSDGGPRKLVFVGDLVDRGPKSPAVLRLVMRLVSEGKALCVPGNHDTKLQRKLFGKNVQITHGLGETLEQLDRETPEFVESGADRVEEALAGLARISSIVREVRAFAHAGQGERQLADVNELLESALQLAALHRGTGPPSGLARPHPALEHRHVPSRQATGPQPGRQGPRSGQLLDDRRGLDRQRAHQQDHVRRARRWATMQLTADETRKGSMPILRSRLIVDGASFVCSVLKTKCPVSAA